MVLIAGISAGKTTVVSFLKDKGFTSYRLSNEIRKVANDLGLNSDDREVLQKIGNKLRKENGPDYLAVRGVEEMSKYRGKVIFDGVRHPDELAYLRSHYGNDLLVIGITASVEVRSRRAKEREQYSGEEKMTKSEFKRMDDSENFSDKPHKMKVKECLDKADYIISNDSDLESFKSKIEDIIEKEF